MVNGISDGINPKTHIIIKGAKVHNLKNVNLAIPRNKLVVITGLSGSGKSSLAFDTLYAEGQRRYVESLSSYARQFLGRLDKPDVEAILGISPAIAIEQKVISRNPRSTVGTSTEIYDYLKLLFARVGRTISPVSGKEVKKETITDVVNYINSQPDGTKGMIMFRLPEVTGRTAKRQLEIYLEQGFSRVFCENETLSIEDIKKPEEKEPIYVIVDRISVVSDDEENISRIADSTQIAFTEGNGECFVWINNNMRNFNNRFELDGINFDEPSLNFFSFNNPVGACPTCEGFGKILGIDEDLVVPDKSLSVYEDAIVCWRGETLSVWKDELILHAEKFDFPIHRPYSELNESQREILWNGNEWFSGIYAFFKYVESKLYKIQYRVMLSRYRGRTNCPDCKGTRLRKDANYVKINGVSISELVCMPIDECLAFFQDLKLSGFDQKIADRILKEIISRLQFMCDVGLNYLTLNRLSNTLSGGESQRINLATSLGSSLIGSMYILDEPSIGLHPRDTARLVKVLKNLRDIGNTVIVVEHEEEVMVAADRLIDLGPMAGSHGGEIVFEGTHDELLKETRSLTAKYLTGREIIEIPERRRKWNNSIQIKKARANNLKNIDVTIPLNTITVITGVSGSGKSTLVRSILYPVLKKLKGGAADKAGAHDKIEGDLKLVDQIEFIDQNPIGKSSRSNPVTYVKAYDEIRTLFSNEQLSVMNGFKPKHFSFNVEGGRCDLCEGEGFVTIEMQFMADVNMVCESCQGKRFKDEVLEVKYRDKSIYDILELTIEDAIDFFSQSDATTERKIVEKLTPLREVGLGYLKLGQSSSTLSGGEAQRIKLGSFLTKGSSPSKTLFIFDEPTTGLHFHDIKKLLYALNELVEQGHSVVIIEHNMDVIKCADWVIDLGAEGGNAGGNLVFEGTPEELINCKESYTGDFLREKLIAKEKTTQRPTK
ncbi:MAG: excinuclease ABC subunit UvrA [Flavobacteriales bacterium]